MPIYQGGPSIRASARRSPTRKPRDRTSRRRAARRNCWRRLLCGGDQRRRSGEGAGPALNSAQVSYDSNKLGLEVGVRTNLDVLNQQQQVFQTRFNLAQSYYNFIINALRLKQAVGRLPTRTSTDQPRLGRLSRAPRAAARATAPGARWRRDARRERRRRLAPSRRAAPVPRTARDLRDQRVGVVDCAARAGRERVRGCFGEIERVGPDKHRAGRPRSARSGSGRRAAAGCPR